MHADRRQLHRIRFLVEHEGVMDAQLGTAGEAMQAQDVGIRSATSMGSSRDARRCVRQQRKYSRTLPPPRTVLEPVASES